MRIVKLRELFTRCFSRLKQLTFIKPIEEMEFLPSALEVVETPPSPIGRATAWSIMILAVFLVTWSIVGKTDVVAVAEGKIIPSGQIKTIQPLETGIVSKILVHEGQFVEKGDLLIELDTTTSGAEVKRLQVELSAAKLEKVRLDALLAWNHYTGNFPVLISPKGVDEKDVEQLIKYLNQDSEAFLSKIKTYDNEISRLNAKQRAIHHTVGKLKKIYPIVSKKAAARKKLFVDGFSPEIEWLDVEAERIEVEQNLKKSEQEYTEAEAALSVVREQRFQIIAEFRRSNLEQLSEVTTQVESLSQELIKAIQADKVQRIVSPVTGNVQQLGVHTVGGVVTPAQPLMVIVPKKCALEIEAKVQNKDIGFVKQGQTVEIKLEAFPFTEYGVLDGQLSHVSGDSVQTEDNQLYYLARVEMGQSFILVNGKEILLTPGMKSTVEIKIRKRRLIEFFLSPLLKYANESLKER